MIVTGVSFFLGAAAIVMIVISLCGIVIYDIMENRIHSVKKYLIFILLGASMLIFGLLFIITGGTNFLIILRNMEIYYNIDTPFIFLIFMCWNFFIMIRYYCYVLLPEYSKLEENVKLKIAKKTLLMALCTTVVNLLIEWEFYGIIVSVIRFIA